MSIGVKLINREYTRVRGPPVVDRPLLKERVDWIACGVNGEGMEVNLGSEIVIDFF
jgi:hypothetical protein